MKTFERLAEYGWKPPHRSCLAQKTYHGPELTGICIKFTEGYGFIEFEISNSTISTVFRQSLSEARQTRKDSERSAAERMMEVVTREGA